MPDKQKMTDGRDVFHVPASAVPAMTALGWTPVKEPKPPQKTTTRRRRG